ncbi:MAG: hypothetical protein V4714_00490 [Bacteroidota bacterium]
MSPRIALCLLLLLTQHTLQAQEFPKGWVLPIELGQGLRTVSALHTDLYVGSVQLEPMYTLPGNRLRVGATLGGLYTNRMGEGMAGPRLALKLTDGPKLMKSTVYNLQVFGEHLWATHDIRLYGGGLALEVGQLGLFSLRAYHEYEHHEFWLQVSLGFNLHILWEDSDASNDPLR